MKEQKQMPLHIAIIMDGNGRWAKKRGLPRSFGHKKGVENLIRIVRYCSELQLNCLTLFAFSTENWKRPKEEVDYLMQLLNENLDDVEDKLNQRNIRLKVIGEKTNLSSELLQKIQNVEEKTKNQTGMMLNIAFNYGSQDEIIHAMQELEKNHESITKENLEKHLYTKDCPPVDLLIRTSKEYRISNFLLWQIAYSEFYFSDVYWPSFGKKQLDKAIKAYQKRDRRYGGLTKKEK